MKKFKLILLGALAASSLTGCDIIFGPLFGTSSDEPSSSSQSVGSIETADGLLVYQNDGSEFNGTTHNPEAKGSGITLPSSMPFNYEDVLTTTYATPLPASGSQRIIIIPVAFNDYQQYKTEQVRNDIYKTFFGKSSETGWESVSSFYYKSSYSQLNIQGVVSEWYDSNLTTSQFEKLTNPNKTGYDPTWDILEDAVSWYKERYNTKCTEFDTNNDGFIDGVWLVYGAPNYFNAPSLSEDYFWAYTYFDTSVFDNIKYVSDFEKLKSNPVAYHYCWGSFDHMYEGYGKTRMDAHTYIHETGHLLGLPDYYVAGTTKSYSTNYGPMGGVDMMDYNIIDHNIFSKLALGWTRPYVAESSCTITLKPSATSGESLILPTSSSWNGLAFDEYVLLEYYTPEGLNEKDGKSNYPGNGVQGFSIPGIRIYHVDARLVALDNNYDPTGYTSTIKNGAKVDVANDNTASYNYVKGSVGSLQHRLIQVIECEKKRNFDTEYTYYNGSKTGITADNTSLFTAGKTFDFETYKNSFPNYHFKKVSTMNNGGTLPWRVEVVSLNQEGATLRITKI